MVDGINAGVLENAITLETRIPSLFVGRRLVVTVLSNTKDGRVLVSMFGKKFYVETSLNLAKGQVLHLKVHATRPRIVLKPVVHSKADPSFSPSEVDTLIDRLVGSFGNTDIREFDVKRILEHVLQETRHDSETQGLVHVLLKDLSAFAGAVSILYIPFFVDKDSGGRARVSIHKDGDESYAINFDVDMDYLGRIRCTARIKDGLDVEIVSSSNDVVDFLRSHARDLGDKLMDMGLSLKRLEIMQAALPYQGDAGSGMDVVV